MKNLIVLLCLLMATTLLADRVRVTMSFTAPVDTAALALATQTEILGRGRTVSSAGVKLSYTVDDTSSALLDTLRLKPIAESFEGVEFSVKEVKNVEIP